MKLLILTGYAGFTLRTHNILCLLKKKVPIQVTCYVYGKKNFNWLKQNNKDNLYSKIYCIDELLERIEKNLSNINQLNESITKIVKNSKFNITKSLYAERILVQHTHETYYSKQFNQDQINQYLFQIYDHLRKSLDGIDFVYTYHSSSIFSFLISELCKEKKIKFKTLVHDRISETFFFSDSNSQLLPSKKIQKYIQDVEITKESKNIIDDYVNNLKDRNRSSYIISGQIQNLKLLKINYRNIKSFILNFFSKRDLYLQKTNFQRVKEKFKLKFNQYMSLKYFKKKLDLKYKILYLPLQFAPETTTLVSAVDQYDQLSMIKKMSIYIPPDWKLVVKEHPSMIGKRSYNFYKELNRIYNVLLVYPLYNSLELIDKSSAVISVSGTTGLEAYALGKPTLILGDIHYDILKGIKKISNYHEIYDILKRIDPKINNQKNNKIELYKIMSVIRSENFVENKNNEFWTNKTFDTNILDTDKQIADVFLNFLND